MAEQITHKKSLRVARLTRDRELLLSQYRATPEQREPTPAPHTVQPAPELAPPPASAPNSEASTDHDDTDASTQTFRQLVALHNTLLGRENETHNSIKSTIYDNYCDLAQVNALLQGFVAADGPQELVRQLHGCAE
ncbi:Vps51p KNAG_0C01560 [Huiozyma naganishii CBS 8797]|uniref:Uncharacterized protein n=1 Tax=Huiozyma naganishii (strain ATCC MYA-139 / BCRC 22969 / CBS 8797 / KCTC 17520 / NBRC 10181 / NCYC 3082 / Yp74L-3) TaxID=1071383 RepID=J7S4F5_HUIN7|nr:hypothetical protein KNAG_0C01560 [Kazachstania naganishii CBS 8797]CCK69269.1 hypothetical protein KNAG_0C01560 [Kazachstania naganishii CBS 8797]